MDRSQIGASTSSSLDPPPPPSSSPSSSLPPPSSLFLHPPPPPPRLLLLLLLFLFSPSGAVEVRRILMSCTFNSALQTMTSPLLILRQVSVTAVLHCCGSCRRALATALWRCSNRSSCGCCRCGCCCCCCCRCRPCRCRFASIRSSPHLQRPLDGSTR